MLRYGALRCIDLARLFARNSRSSINFKGTGSEGGGAESCP